MDKKFVCKQCGNELQEDDLFCPYCGHKAEIVIPQPEDSLFCTECGEKNSVNESFCSSCGAKLNPDQVEFEEEVASVNSVDVYDGECDIPAVEESANNTATPVRNAPPSNKPKNKALFAKATDPKHGISKPEPEKQSAEMADTSTVDPYDEWLDVSGVDPYDKYNTYDDIDEPDGRVPQKSGTTKHQIIGVIVLIIIVSVICFVPMRTFFFDRVHITPASTRKQDYDENILILQDQARSEFDSAYSATAIRTAEPTSTPTPTITATPTPTPTITAVPTAIPVGSVNIDITPGKSDIGTMVVAYEDDFRLSWYANNAYYYDVSLQGSAGNVIVRGTNTSETYIEITAGNLSTGSYVLFVTAYNSDGIAGSTEKLWFDIVSANTHTDLSNYLGTSLYSFVHEIDGMRDTGASIGAEYSNGTVIAYSPDELDCITYISLERSSNYSICGVSVGQSLKEAANTLSDAGWWIIDKLDMSADYQDSEGNTILIWAEDGYTIDSISIYLSDDTLADMYPSYFDYDDDWGTYTEDIEMVYTTGDVNIRKGPGKDYDSAGVIKADTVVTYLGNSSVDERGVVWYNILYNGIDGWVSSKYAELLY